jgi:hypothetical protein
VAVAILLLDTQSVSKRPEEINPDLGSQSCNVGKVHVFQILRQRGAGVDPAHVLAELGPDRVAGVG